MWCFLKLINKLDPCFELFHAINKLQRSRNPSDRRIHTYFCSYRFALLPDMGRGIHWWMVIQWQSLWTNCSTPLIWCSLLHGSNGISFYQKSYKLVRELSKLLGCSDCTLPIMKMTRRYLFRWNNVNLTFTCFPDICYFFPLISYNL